MVSGFGGGGPRVPINLFFKFKKKIAQPLPWVFRADVTSVTCLGPVPGATLDLNTVLYTPKRLLEDI